MSKKSRKSAAAQRRATTTYQRSSRANEKVRSSKDSPRSTRLSDQLNYNAPSMVLRVRIGAIVVALVSLLAAVEWALRLQASYSVATVVGIVLLAFLAGLAGVIAFNTEAVMKRLSQSRKR